MSDLQNTDDDDKAKRTFLQQRMVGDGINRTKTIDVPA